MTYKEIKPIIQQGKIGKLPNFEGYFRWNYSYNDIEFYNDNYICPANQLDIKNRNDFYYII